MLRQERIQGDSSFSFKRILTDDIRKQIAELLQNNPTYKYQPRKTTETFRLTGLKNAKAIKLAKVHMFSESLFLLQTILIIPLV
jgi:hypothetical protein